MTEQQQLLYKKKSILLLAVLTIAGFAGNYFALHLFTGFNYLFGSIAVLLVVRLFGMRWGFVAGVVASSWTVVLFGHPYAMIWLCGEPLFVGWLLTKGRTRNLVLYDTLYWPLIGVPLIWCFFRLVMHASVMGTIAAMLMYWLIGICNALIATLLLTYVPRLATAGEQEEYHSIPIHQILFNLLMAIVVIPAMIVLILNGKDAEQRYLSEMYDNLGDSSRIALYETKLKLQKQLASRSQVSRLPQESDFSAPGIKAEDFKELLLNARVRQHQQITLLDGAGKVLTSTNNVLASQETFDVCKNGTMSRVTDSSIYQCLPSPTSPMPLWQRAQKSTYSLSVPGEHANSWSVVVETPFAPYQQRLLKEHIKSLLVALCLNLLALATSLSTSRRLTAPLRRLSSVTTDLPQRLLREKISIWPESMVTEIDQLISNFRVMATALSQKFQEITYANETLELRVEERTKELTRANEELQKEIAEREMTERQRDHLTDELVNQVRFLQTLINAIPSPIYYKDRSGRYQSCNRAFEECFGVSRDMVIGKTVHDIFPLQMAETYHESDQELFAQRGVQVFEAQLIYADGRNHAVVFYKATYDDIQGNLGGMVGIIVDISELKQAEAARNDLMLELKLKNKELEGIVYVASHDLRSPLVNVQGFSRKLAKNCAELDRIISGLDLDMAAQALLEPILRQNIPKSLGFITSSIEKMDGLLSALLRLSRLGRAALCFDNLDMQEILSTIVTSMTYQIEASGARVELGNLGACLADREQVTQIFSNLLDNAIKYRSPERSLQIKVYSEDFSEGMRYCVEDNGVGIHHDHQDKIWEIFQRLNPEDSEGEGLGLTLVRRIVDRLGGAIWVESEPGLGSRFYVVLPKAHDMNG